MRHSFKTIDPSLGRTSKNVTDRSSRSNCCRLPF